MSHSVTFDHIRSHSRKIRICGGAKYIGISRSELSRTLTFSASDSALYNIKGGKWVCLVVVALWWEDVWGRGREIKGGVSTSAPCRILRHVCVL